MRGQVFAVHGGTAHLGRHTNRYCTTCALPYTTTREVSSINVLGLGRLDLGLRAFAEIGAGGCFFDGFTDLGMMGAIGYSVKINDMISVPIKARADFVLDSESPMVVPAVTVGVRINFKR